MLGDRRAAAVSSPVAVLEDRHPVGKRWNFDDDHEMRSRYPRLYAQVPG